MKNFYFILFFFMVSNPFVFAQSNNYTESLTITTYYPAPYGVYRDLIARKSFAVGNFTSGQVQALNPGQLQVEGSLAVGSISAADARNLKSGQFYVGESLILKPQSAVPANPGKEGELVYVSSKNAVYLYTPSTGWSPIIGGPVTPVNPITPVTPVAPDPAGTIKGAITLTTHLNAGNAGGYNSCTSTDPGKCIAGGPGAGTTQITYHEACDSGWRAISTGATGGDYRGNGAIWYYSCQKL